MGIVITVILLLVLLAFTAMTLNKKWVFLHRASVRRMLGLLALLAGLWNAFWYGVQHLTEFWGLVALASGIVMIASAGYLLSSKNSRPMQILLCVLLLVFFLLYAVTIIQLNLGMPILK